MTTRLLHDLGTINITFKAPSPLTHFPSSPKTGLAYQTILSIHGGMCTRSLGSQSALMSSQWYALVSNIVNVVAGGKPELTTPTLQEVN